MKRQEGGKGEREKRERGRQRREGERERGRKGGREMEGFHGRRVQIKEREEATGIRGSDVGK